MRNLKRMAAGVAVALMLAAGMVQAGSNLNEVGAVLVYPAIIQKADPPTDGGFETFVTITNASAEAKNAHISFINGRQYFDPCDPSEFADGDPDGPPNCDTQPDPSYCYECDWTIPLSGNDTETIIVTTGANGGVVMQIEGDGVGDSTTDQHANEDQMSCEFPYGMIVVTLEDPETGETLTDNVLLGEQVIVQYEDGWALSMPAVSLQGGVGGDGNRTLHFDDVEFGKLPRIVAADFIAPEVGVFDDALVTAEMVLFTLAFERQAPPRTDCSITGYDADENPFSRSIQFGCWDFFDLEQVSPEFAYPNLGQGLNAKDTHGWLQLNCKVDPDGNVPPVYTVNGGVHGAIIQLAFEGAQLRRGNANFAQQKPDGDAPAFGGEAAWGRLLYQSVTTGDAVTLLLEEEGLGAGQCNPLVENCN